MNEHQNIPDRPRRYSAPDVKLFGLSPRRVLCQSPEYGATEDPWHQYIDDGN